MTDKVLSIMDWWDGPRAGVAEYNRQPYLYNSAYFYCSPELLQVNNECDYDLEKDIFLLWPIRIDSELCLAVWNNFLYYNRLLTAKDRQQWKESGENANWLEVYESQTRMVYAQFDFSPYDALLCRAQFRHQSRDESFVTWHPWHPNS